MRRRLLCKDYIGLGKAEARCGEGPLKVHSRISDVHEQSWHRLPDRVPAWCADRDPRLPFLERDYRYITGQLVSARKCIHRVACRLEGRIRQGIVEPDSRAGWHDAAAEDVADRLRSRNDIAPLISDDEMRRVDRTLRGHTRRHEGPCAHGIDFTGEGIQERS